MSDKRPQRNDHLRQARLRLPSPSGSGRPMSREELADAVNEYLFRQTDRVFDMDGNHIGKFELGEYRWPRAHYRDALRAVLGAATDADLGFYPRRRTTAPPEPAIPDPPLGPALHRPRSGRGLPHHRQ